MQEPSHPPSRYGRFRPSGWKSERERRAGVSAMGSVATAALMLRRAESAGGAVPRANGGMCSVSLPHDSNEPSSPGAGMLQTSRSTPADLGAAFASSEVDSPSALPAPPSVQSPPVLPPVPPEGAGLGGGGDEMNSGSLFAARREEPSSDKRQLGHFSSLGGGDGAGLARGSASSLPLGPHPGLVTWQDVWQYAGRSVLYDIRKRQRATNAPR